MTKKKRNKCYYERIRHLETRIRLNKAHLAAETPVAKLYRNFVKTNPWYLGGFIKSSSIERRSTQLRQDTKELARLKRKTKSTRLLPGPLCTMLKIERAFCPDKRDEINELLKGQFEGE